MKSTKATLLIPVENQVRKPDFKVLLACVAARHGFSSVIGFRRDIHFHISSFRLGQQFQNNGYNSFSKDSSHATLKYLLRNFYSPPDCEEFANKFHCRSCCRYPQAYAGKLG